MCGTIWGFTYVKGTLNLNSNTMTSPKPHKIKLSKRRVKLNKYEETIILLAEYITGNPYTGVNVVREVLDILGLEKLPKKKKS